MAVAVSWLADMMDTPPLSGRASLPLVLWDSASTTFINRLQIIPNKAAEVPRLHHRDLEWHTLWKIWCIIMPILFHDKKLLLLLGPQARCFFWSCTCQLEVWTAALCLITGCSDCTWQPVLLKHISYSISSGFVFSYIFDAQPRLSTWFNVSQLKNDFKNDFDLC